MNISHTHFNVLSTYELFLYQNCWEIFKHSAGGWLGELLCWWVIWHLWHSCDVITSALVSKITSVSILGSTACSGVDQRKHISSASLSLVRKIQRWPVNSPHKGPVTRKIFPLDDVIMVCKLITGEYRLRYSLMCNSLAIILLYWNF